MLTNVYYYDIYRPYILGSRQYGESAPRRDRIANRREAQLTEPSGKVFILNKSYKDEIVDYAHNVSYGVTGLRATARRTLVDMENFNRDIHETGLNRAREDLADDLEEFAERYNGAGTFLQTQRHSAELRTFSNETADSMYFNRARLAALGLTLSESGRLDLNRGKLTSMTQDGINVAIGENIQIFSDLQRRTGELLKEPLAGHMNFKNLSYHYNYKMGALVADDGFGIIESGLLIDKAV